MIDVFENILPNNYETLLQIKINVRHTMVFDISDIYTLLFSSHHTIDTAYFIIL